MALASCPAFHGQQRSLRRMCQVFSWALARSPGIATGHGRGWRPSARRACSVPSRAAQQSTGPNADPTRNPAQTVAARDGESVQQLLSRLGADPATWRSAMAGVTSPLDLAAGMQVQLGPSVAVDAGIGVAAGFGAGAGIGDVTSADASTGASADG